MRLPCFATSPLAWRRSIRSGAGKCVFITGCSSGIGRACAELFAESGYNVVATARDVSSIEGRDGIPSVIDSPAGIVTTACDVGDDDSRRAAIEFALKKFGRIDVLVNNAGYGLFGPIEYLPIEEARRQLEVNTLGAMHLAQLVIPGMRKAGWGRIINVSSVAGRMTVPLGGWYSASKHALEALADALRLELQPFGIETVSILPGPVTTEFKQNVKTPVKDIEDAPDVYRSIGEKMRERTPAQMRAAVSAEVVAKVILKAAQAERPHPRYYINARTRFSVMLRKVLSDRAWDRLVARFYSIDKFTNRKSGSS